MSVLICGLNHRTASLELRERVAFSKDSLPDALRCVQADLTVPEVAILSTCNRTEIHCHFKGEDQKNTQARRLGNWLADFRGLNRDMVTSSCYRHYDEQAVRHVIRVASGLDSMILGEPQIMGQVKVAYATALGLDVTGPVLNQLSQHSLSAAKRIRSETGIGQNPVSLAYVVIKLARQIYADFNDCTALLVGAGEMIELMARQLTTVGIGRMFIANRTLERAKDLAQMFGAQPIALGELREILPRADLVITSTGSQTPLIGKGVAEEALRQRRHKPMFMADLAVPRDIEPEVARLDDAYLYSIDDLQGLVAENNKRRAEAANEAEGIVQTSASNFIDYLKGHDAAPTIRALRERTELLATQELVKARALLAKGVDADVVLERLVHALTNKWLHRPSIELRDAAKNQSSLVALARLLYGLNQDSIDASGIIGSEDENNNSNNEK